MFIDLLTPMLWRSLTNKLFLDVFNRILFFHPIDSEPLPFEILNHSTIVDHKFPIVSSHYQLGAYITLSFLDSKNIYSIDIVE
jgi:hypothetical protein